MKTLLLDDKSTNDEYVSVFFTEWGLRPENVVTATTDQEALAKLRDPEVGLLVVDLLWESQPEHESVKPLGLDYLETIREQFPHITVVSRSVITQPRVLARLLGDFVRLRVDHHFISGDPSPHTALRRRVVIGSAERELSRRADEHRYRGLGAHLGDPWAAVVFADVSGFTQMTEQTWWMCREKLWTALADFYGRAMEAVVAGAGSVDKFIGDEVMAVFIAQEVGQQAERARAAVDVARRIVNVFREVERQFKLDLGTEDEQLRDVRWKIKVGAEAGRVMIRRVLMPAGEEEYCVLGPAVNLASRIKGLAGDYGVALGPTIRGRLPQGGYETERIETGDRLKGVFGNPAIFRLIE